MIDRVQVLEFKFAFKAGQLKVYHVAKTEFLNSCIKTMMNHENLKTIQQKIA